MNNIVFILLMVLIVIISLIGHNCYKYYDLEEKYKLICDQCDKTIKEFNEIMFGSPPLKNKVVIVRSIKDYDYSAYRKDIGALNEYLKDGWSIVNHETNEFVHTYILGKPLAWCKENGGDNNDE